MMHQIAHKDFLERAASSDAEVRRQVALRLGGCPDEACCATLLRLLRDGDWRVRKAAVESIVTLRRPEYLPGLLGLLDDSANAGARNSAIEALIRYGRLATACLTDAFRSGDRDRRKFIIDILGEVGDPACVPLILEALHDPDENVQASAVEHLGIIGDASVLDELIEILEKAELWVAFPAADALGKFRDPRAVPPLIRALSRRVLREPALRALGRLAHPDAFEVIVPYMASTSRPVQLEALRALVSMYRASPVQTFAGIIERELAGTALELLIHLAKAEEPELRQAAVLLLGFLEDERSLSLLLELSGEEDLEEPVWESLLNIARARPAALIPYFREPVTYRRRMVCRVARETAHPGFAPHLRERLRDSDGHVRAYAALALGQLGDTGAVPEIERLLTDRYQDVQEAGVLALSRLSVGVSRAQAISMLKEKNPILRRNYSMLLGLLREESAVNALTFALKDAEVPVRMAAVEALSLIGGENAEKALQAALTDEIPEIRRVATLSLGETGSRHALKNILLVARDEDDWVRAAAAQSLAHFTSEESEQTLVSMLEDPCGLVRVAAIETLARVGGEKCLPVLQTALKDVDAEIRRSAVQAVSSVAVGPEAEGALLPLLEDEDWSVRKSVAETLSRSCSGEAVRALRDHLTREEDPSVTLVIRECLDAQV